MANRLNFLLAFSAYMLYSGLSLKCYECSYLGSDQNDCTTRECVGVWCQITIAVDVDEGTKLTSKNCADTQPVESDTSGLYGNCKSIVNGGTQYAMCACKNEDYCNNQSTVAHILLGSSIAVLAAPTVNKKTKCRQCSASSCSTEEVEFCEQQWCVAQIVYDKLSNQTIVSKRCSEQSHDGRIASGCTYVEQLSSALMICSCNEDYCTDDEPMRALIRNRLIANPVASGSSDITSAFSNGADVHVAVEQLLSGNATQEFLLANNITTSTAPTFVISFSIVFLELFLILFVC